MNTMSRSVRRISSRQPPPAAALLHSSPATTQLRFPAHLLPVQLPSTPRAVLSKQAPTAAITSNFHSSSSQWSQTKKTASAYTDLEGTLQTLTLPDNRKMSYRCYGPPDGKPMFYFHGTPSSASEAVAFKPFIDPRNVFVIGTSRPGYGKSDPHPGRTITDHVHDILAIADSLGIDKFHVMGASGGGPYVLACANTIPKDRLLGAAVVAGVSPWELGLKGMYFQGWLRFRLLKHFPNLMIPMARKFWAKQKQKDPEELEKEWRKEIGQFGWGLGAKDKEALKDPQLMDEFIVTFFEGYEQGPDGGLDDSLLILNDWGFKLEDIPYEGIKMYYGTEDGNTPVGPAKEMFKMLKKAKWMEFEGEGHFSIYANKGHEIFEDFFKED